MDSNQAGRAGEFYIAYVLEKNGIECHHVDLQGTDLWCQLENGKMFTVQVKSATTPFAGKIPEIRADSLGGCMDFVSLPPRKRTSLYTWHSTKSDS